MSFIFRQRTGPLGPTRVVVTGAGGQTGSLVVQKLLAQKVATTAVVRSETSEASLREKLGDAKDLQVALADVTQPESLKDAFKGADGLIIVTSSMPRLLKSSLVGVVVAKIVSLGYASKKPSFYFDEGQTPEEVDWIGQRSQIDAAKACGIKHIVLVSSMAGTKPDHFLNTQMDNLVLWKRKAECYLMSSQVPYTIIHPGSLLPHYGDKTPAPGGRRELFAGLDDSLLDDEEKSRSLVPREDVAAVCVSCIMEPQVSQGRSFDLGASCEEDEPKALNLKALLEPLQGKNCTYTKEDAEFKANLKARSCPCGVEQ